MSDRTGQDLVFEVTFLLAISGHYLTSLCLRFREGKLVMGSEGLAGCYQLMLRDPDKGLENGWTSCKRFVERYEESAGFEDRAVKGKELLSKDFWVHDV